jgi:SAM-dependent methyltransferase
MNNEGGLMLYFYGLKIGIQSLLRWKLTEETIKNLVIPVNYWRTLEYRLAFEELQPQKTDRILDIGSPKLLSLFLADRVGAEDFSTDIDDYFLNDYSFFREIKSIPAERFHVLTEDGRNLSFKDNFFSKVYSISVIEHIPESGDTACLKEIARVLTPGGRCIITVPLSPISKNVYKKTDEIYWANSSGKGDENGKIFYLRRYSEEDLYKRLIVPSGLKLRKLQFIGEKILVNSSKELSDFLHPITGHIQPILSHLFHTKPASSRKELKKPLAALIVLEKANEGGDIG